MNLANILEKIPIINTGVQLYELIRIATAEDKIVEEMRAEIISVSSGGHSFGKAGRQNLAVLNRLGMEYSAAIKNKDPDSAKEYFQKFHKTAIKYVDDFLEYFFRR